MYIRKGVVLRPLFSGKLLCGIPTCDTPEDQAVGNGITAETAGAVNAPGYFSGCIEPPDGALSLNMYHLGFCIDLHPAHAMMNL